MSGAHAARPRWNVAVDLLGLAGAIVALMAFRLLPRSDLLSASQLFLTGALLLAGVFAGHLVGRLGVPRITGCIALGVALGPSLSELVRGTPLAHAPVLSQAQAEPLGLVDDLAVGLIALMAGAEARVAELRARLRAVLSVSFAQCLALPAALAATLLAVSHAWSVPFLDRGAARVPAALLIGAVLAANSPTVVVSLLKETGARGPLATTVMGVSVVMDALMILAFAVLVAVVASAGGGGEGVLRLGGAVLAGIAWSIAVGAGIGVGLRRYTERTDHRLGYTVVAIALVVAAVGRAFGLDPLFCLLAAGFVCENGGRRRTPRASHRLDEALKRVSQPVFIVFFTSTGLGVDLVALRQAWPLVLAVTVVRVAGIWACARGGAALAREAGPARRDAWIGLLAQGGVTLALARMLAARFPGWGDAVEDLVVAMVGVHVIAVPLAFVWSLRRAGELPRQA